jgi:hypothetical protein
MTSSATNEVDLVEFYCAIHSAAGNFALFETADGHADELVWEEMDVWTLRKLPDEAWQHIGTVYATEEPKALRMRVTRYPSLEKETIDTTYHPSVESWKIDPDKVKEFLHGNQ